MFLKELMGREFYLQILRRFPHQVPEPASLPYVWVEAPWDEPSAARRLNFPRPTNIHSEQRSKCLAMFAAVRKRPIQERADRPFRRHQEKGRLSQAN
jgi:hypothetical protein